MRMAFVAVIGLLSTCAQDETVRAYGAGGRVWVLQSVDGAPFAAPATLTFPGRHRVAGEAPCNRFFADQAAPYPWFEIANLGSTRRACPDLAAEAAFLEALAAMTLSEVSGDTLVLSTPEGREMVFTVPPGG